MMLTITTQACSKRFSYDVLLELNENEDSTNFALSSLLLAASPFRCLERFFDVITVFRREHRCGRVSV